MIDFQLFRSLRFSAGVGVALLAACAYMGLQFIVSQELQLVRGLTPLAAGVFVLPVAVASFVSGMVAGRFMLGVGVERMMALTVGAAAVGMLLYRYTGHVAPMAWELSVLALIGFGAGGAMAVASTAIMISAPDEQAGMAGSIESISYELGGTVGVAIMGSVMGSIYTRSFSPPAGLDLPPNAWAGIEQAVASSETLPQSLAAQVVGAGKVAYLDGVSASLTLAAVVMLVLFAALLLAQRRQIAVESSSRK